MALSTCEDCGKDVSTLASACPYCGRPQASIIEKDIGDTPIDCVSAQRVPCPDGSCTGVIESGYCRSCGKPLDWQEGSDQESDDDGFAVVQRKTKGSFPLEIVLAISVSILVFVSFAYALSLMGSKKESATARTTNLPSAPAIGESVEDKNTDIMKQTRDHLEKIHKLVKLSGSRGESHYYHEETIATISEDIKQVADENVDQKSNVIRTLRFNCRGNQYAIGETKGYAYGKLVSNLDFSKNGWVYFDITQKDDDERKLHQILCSGNGQ